MNKILVFLQAICFLVLVTTALGASPFTPVQKSDDDFTKSALQAKQDTPDHESSSTTQPKPKDPIAGDRPVVRLWPLEMVGGEKNKLSLQITNRGKLRYENVKDPNMVVFQTDREQPTPAVLYCPGGAYKHLTPKPSIIQWLNKNGITVFMLRYTVPAKRESAFCDVQRAMRLVRHHAKKWNVDPEQIGVLGSSAGGHLVARLSQNYTLKKYPVAPLTYPIDEADRQSPKPRFVILASAAYFFKSTGKGKNKKLQTVLAEEFPMTAKVPPTFLVYAKDDRNHVAGGVAYEKALKASGNKTRIMISETGGHELQDVPWHPQCANWLTGLGIKLTQRPQ